MKNKKNLKKRSEKIFSLFEILILVTSVITFAYFIGEEFGFVSAEDTTPVAPPSGLGISATAPGEGMPASAVAAEAAAKVASVPVPSTAGSGLVSTEGYITAANPTEVAGSGLAPEGESYLLGTQATGEQAATAANAAATPATPTTANGFWGNILHGVVQMGINAADAAILYVGTYYILTGIFKVNSGASASLSAALASGYFYGAGAGALLSLIPGVSGLSIISGWGFVLLSGWGLIGVGVGALYWVFFGVTDEKIESVQFTCSPWQPQSGGTNCDTCNHGDLPCTKSKCQSLGAACNLLNEGTSEEACSWVNRNDISAPTITAWNGPLDKTNYEYDPYTATLPGDKGVLIKYKNSADGCAPAFSRIFYGISLDKEGKCKVDINRTDTFDEMSQLISNGNYQYNHTILSIHGGGTELANEGLNLTNGGNYQVYVRCQSANGYSNTGTFVFKYCVQSQADITAPNITLTDPINGWPIASGTTSQQINVYTNKPSDCKWSHTNQGYDSMPNNMTCSQSIKEMNANTFYQCSTNLTGLKDNVENDFYFNCKSYPLNPPANQYAMATNYVYKLFGTQPLVITSVTPNSTTITDSTQSVKVTLTAITSAGFNKGNAYCSFKNTADSDSSYALFYSDSSSSQYQHSQDLYLNAGSYDYTIKCCDIAPLSGNCATQETTFNVETDFQPPTIIRVYNNNNQLEIVTDEKAQCVYGTNDCNYDFKDGVAFTTTDNIEHTTDWNTNSNFYIKCQDSFGNLPAPDQCSLIVRPFSSY